MRIGAQMYTVREFCDTHGGIEETLKKIADIGYKNVQISGTCDFNSGWMKRKLDEFGLKCVLTHYDREKIAVNPHTVISEHEALDCDSIGIGWYELNDEGVEGFYKKFINAAREISGCGMRLCYHNHDQEFVKDDGVTRLEQLCSMFAPDQLYITLDTFWVQAAGADICDWLGFLRGRVPFVHLKDMGYPRKMLPLGEGNINFDKVIDACGDAECEYLLVEQDDCNGVNPFDCLAKSFDYLKSFGLVD